MRVNVDENRRGGDLRSGSRQPFNYSSYLEERAVRKHGIAGLTAVAAVLDCPFRQRVGDVGYRDRTF